MEDQRLVLPKRRERRKKSVIPFLKKPKKPAQMPEEQFEGRAMSDIIRTHLTLPPPPPPPPPPYATLSQIYKKRRLPFASLGFTTDGTHSVLIWLKTWSLASKLENLSINFWQILLSFLN